ncbi:MAG: SEC-C domain-containing protein [Acidobacteria bacterium]|nr:SEC-C domain-containing protein [Acidobacteriota bacterium]
MAKSPKAGRNDLCPCGSGRKFKKCCDKKAAGGTGRWLAVLVVGALLAAVAFAASWALRDPGSSTPRPGQVWSEEHGHYH